MTFDEVSAWCERASTPTLRIWAEHAGDHATIHGYEKTEDGAFLLCMTDESRDRLAEKIRAALAAAALPTASP